MAVEAKEDFLGRVLGVLSISQEAPGCRVHSSLMQAHDGIKSVQVALARLVNEISPLRHGLGWASVGSQGTGCFVLHT